MQAAQSLHAFREFIEQHKEIESEWYKNSNYIVILSVNNEKELINLIQKASSRDILISLFREPDLNDEITAIAIEPGEKSRKLCSNIKLAFK